ncbi:MAG: glycosyltransferase [Acidithiobacillales bacterium]
MRILALDLGAGWRGGQTQTALICAGLAARGHAVTLVARRNSALAREMYGDAAGGSRVVVAPAGFEASPGLLLAVAREARRLAPEVVWASDARGHGAAVWSRVSPKTPLVVHRRVSFPPGRGPLHRLKYRAARRFVAVSQGVATSLRQAGIEDARITVLPDGLPSGAYVDRPKPEAPPYRLVHVGAFDGLKGQRVAIAALERLLARGLDATLLFLGDGPLRARAEIEAASLGLASRCVFAGEVRDVPERLASSHLLLLPSQSEGASMTLMEAMAAGCPVLVHDLPGPRELCRNGTAGALVPTLDPAAWAEEIGRLLLHPSERACYIVGGRAAAAQWTIERTLDRLELLLGEA